MVVRTLLNARGGGTSQVSDPGYDQALRDNANLKRKSDRQHSEVMGAYADVREAQALTDRILTQAKEWKAHAQYKEATLDAVIEIAKKEHATSEAYRLTAQRLWEESAKAPRPEERPFAQDVAGIRTYQENVFKETLTNDTTVSDKVKRIKDRIRPKYKS